MGSVAFGWLTPGTVGGLVLGLLAAVAIGGVVYGRARSRRALVSVALGGLTFQVVHLIEHAAQAGFWVGHRADPPYLTPWAASARDGLGYWCRVWPGQGPAAARGNELLHLAGNAIFFAAVVAMLVLARRAGVASRSSRWATILQGVHVAEHLALTVTLFATASPRGLSTIFGLVAGPGLVAYRVWWHFVVNLAATLFAMRAGVVLWRAGVFGRGTEPVIGVVPATG